MHRVMHRGSLRGIRRGAGLRGGALLLCLLSLIVLLPRPAAAEGGEAPAEAARILVSLGDSYSSGEGILPFYGQDKDMFLRCTDEDWLAHRSELAWGGMLRLPDVEGTMAENRNVRWFFAASSGALMEHVRTTGPSGEGQQRKNYRRNGVQGSYALPGQLDVITDNPAFDPAQVAYVTITISGNDAEFAELMARAVSGNLDPLHFGGLEEKLAEVLETKPQLRAGLKQTWQRIAEAAPNAWILAAGYPKLVTACTAGIPIDGREAELLNDAVSEYNQMMAELAEECRGEGMRIWFVSVEEAFEGHAAYSDDPYLNGLLVGRGEQELDERLPLNSGSFHPNEKGARAYAACVQAVIDRLEAERAAEQPSETEQTEPEALSEPETPPETEMASETEALSVTEIPPETDMLPETAEDPMETEALPMTTETPSLPTESDAPVFEPGTNEAPPELTEAAPEAIPEHTETAPEAIPEHTETAPEAIPEHTETAPEAPRELTEAALETTPEESGSRSIFQRRTVLLLIPAAFLILGAAVLLFLIHRGRRR